MLYCFIKRIIKYSFIKCDGIIDIFCIFIILTL